MERSLLSNRHVFAAATFAHNDKAHEAYLTAWDLAEGCLPHPTHTTIVYLRTTPDTCLQRIGSRARPQERDIKLTYLQQLHTLHDEWLLHNPRCITIDASAHPAEITHLTYARLNIRLPNTTPNQTQHPRTGPVNPHIMLQTVLLNSRGHILSWQHGEHREYLATTSTLQDTEHTPWPHQFQQAPTGTPLYHTTPMFQTSANTYTQTHLAAVVDRRHQDIALSQDIHTTSHTDKWHDIKTIREHLHSTAQYELADAITGLVNRARQHDANSNDTSETCLTLRAGMPLPAETQAWPTPTELAEQNRTNRSSNTITFFSSSKGEYGQFSNFYDMGPQQYCIPTWIHNQLCYRRTIVYNT